MSDKNITREMLQALNAAQIKLDAVKKAKEEPIAIIGMSCRFPGAKNLNAFWELLSNGVDAISDVPANRWDIDAYYDENPDADGKMYSRYGGFIDNVDQFDAQFFDISPKEAKMLDPQQRLLLEVAVEALEHANQPLEKLSRSATGVFVGISSFDYAYRIQKSDTSIDANLGTGTLASPAAGRISYFLGAQGPSMVIDTACSSSLVAIHQAMNSLRSQETNMALVGGVGVIAAPNLTIAFSRAQMLSVDSRCKTFDAGANGYVRSEGCGVVVLKRLSDAIKNGDTILALIKGSAVNQDGASGGLTIPNGPAQEAVIQQALKNANLKANDIHYVEAHGTGTSLGDPIEVNALGHVFSERETPLIIGSVKTNIGHAEAAAGMASLIKVVLSLQQEQIPANLHFKQPNPHISWDKLSVTVAQQKTAWPRTEKSRAAGISAFGFSGTNAHLIVTETPLVTLVSDHPNDTPYILTLSAKTAAALDAQVAQFLQYLTTHTDLAVADICLTSNLRRTHFKERLAFIVSSIAEIKEKLFAYQTNHHHTETEAIALSYMAGEKILWENHFRDRKYNNLTLPTYPWQKNSYWIDVMNQQATPSLSSLVAYHPFLQKRIHGSMIATGQVVFESCISVDDFSYLSQHRLYDKAIFLGAGYIEMAFAAAVELFHAGHYLDNTSLTIREVLIKQPLVLSEAHEASLVQLILSPNDVGYDFKIMSMSNAKDETWIEHIQGQIVPSSEASITDTPLDLNALKQKIHQPIDAKAYYDMFSSIGVDYGPAFQVLHQLWRDPISGDVLGLIDLPEVVVGAEKYYCHPLLLDGCFQLLAAALQIQNNDEKIYYLLRLESLRLLHRSHSKMWCYIRPAQRKNAGILSTFDAYLLDENGVVAAEMLNLQTHRADRKALLSQATQQWQYEILWQPRPLPLKENALMAHLSQKKNWLILADYHGCSEKLVEFLQTHGQHCDIASGEEDLKQLAQNAIDYQYVVHLWSLDRRFDTSSATLTASVDLSTGLLHLIQTLVKTKKQMPRICVVTRHAQPVTTSVEEIEQAALWGFGRVLALEHPELKSLFIDIDNYSPQSVESVLEEIVLSEREQQVAFRNVERYVARLRHALFSEKKSVVTIDATGSYLITGGLGGLGLQIAHHLVALGARHLLLMSRQGASTPQAQAEVKRLEDKGVTVKVIKGDISQETLLLESELKHQIGHSLRGVIHTAGVLDDGMIVDQTAQRFSAVLAPKIQGTWNLHRLTLAMPLDFFVCFSSMTSVMGAMGQANYAVANAFMDAFCQYRHSNGLPALSISWGPWNSPGMAANQVLINHWNKIGMGVIAPEQGMDIFERLLNSQVAHMGVIAMEWSKYPDDSSLFEYLKPTTLSKNIEEISVIDKIKSEHGDQRRKLLIRYIENKICFILGYDLGQSFPVTQGFFELGINSLTSVEFRNYVQQDLACRLPSTLVFDYPTIKKLVDYLMTEVLNEDEAVQEKDESYEKSSPQLQLPKNNQSSTDAAQALADELGISWE